jgi:hypothetical protein
MAGGLKWKSFFATTPNPSKGGEKAKKIATESPNNS